jgi:sec-independent protein translocase protein TatB
MELFGVGAGEAILILIIAMLVVGPERFPTVAREAGRWYRKARMFTAEVTADMRVAMNELEKEVQAQGDELRSVREIGESVQGGLQESAADIRSIGRDTATAAGPSSAGTPSSATPEATSSAPAPAPAPVEPLPPPRPKTNDEMLALVRSSFSEYHQPSSPAPSADPSAEGGDGAASPRPGT